MLDATTYAAAVKARPSYALLPRFEDGSFDYLDDATYLKINYKAITGKALRLDPPRTFDEKIAWLKLHDHNPLYHRLVDKYQVRGFVEGLLGQDWLVPLLGVWDRPEDIDFAALPERFVLKCTAGYGATIVCTDKAALDPQSVCERLSAAMRTDYFSRAREWAYKDPTPRVICEEYLGEPSGSLPLDYKFMCFSGKARYVCLSRSVSAAHDTAGAVSFFTPDKARAPFRRLDYPDLADADVVWPDAYPEMLAAAERLAKATGAPFVRVDLYEHHGRPCFGEFTFYPCGGTMMLEPADAGLALGEELRLTASDSQGSVK
jgi:hypothetical protein